MSAVKQATSPVQQRPSAGSPYRVMLVDDSAVIRGMLARWISNESDCVIVGSYPNGAQAVQHVKTCGAEIVVLDIEMPVMDGLTALPLLLKEVPGLQVLMASTLTARNADISMRALSLGAVDYIPKPESARVGSTTSDFQRDLLDKIKALGGRLRRRSGVPASGAAPVATVSRQASAAVGPAKPAALVLRKPSKIKPEILAIGSSTGGPQALFTFLGGLGKKVDVPIVITQHMPPTFTAILAEHIQKLTGIPASEGAVGDVVEPGKIIIAPGDYHMTLVQMGTKRVVKLDQGPQVNFCRPAVDPMFKSVSGLYGAGTLAVVLTGMGHDGREGGRTIVNAGGSVVAQDEETSIVWGMPGAVAEAGLCSAVVPLNDMAALVRRYLQGAAE